MATPYDDIRWFAERGEMLRELKGRGLRVPNGFAVAGAACRAALDRAGAWEHLQVAPECQAPTRKLVELERKPGMPPRGGLD